MRVRAAFLVVAASLCASSGEVAQGAWSHSDGPPTWPLVQGAIHDATGELGAFAGRSGTLRSCRRYFTNATATHAPPVAAAASMRLSRVASRTARNALRPPHPPTPTTPVACPFPSPPVTATEAQLVEFFYTSQVNQPSATTPRPSATTEPNDARAPRPSATLCGGARSVAAPLTSSPINHPLPTREPNRDDNNEKTSALEPSRSSP